MKKGKKNTHSSVTCTSANKPVIRPRQDTSQFPSHANRNHHISNRNCDFWKIPMLFDENRMQFWAFWWHNSVVLIGSVQISVGVIERIQAAACHRRAAWRWSCLKNGRRLKGSCPGEQRHTQKNEEEGEQEARAAGRSRRRRGWPHSADGLTAVAEQRVESSFRAVRCQRRCLSDVCEILVYCTQSLSKSIQIIYRVLHFKIHRYCIPTNIVLSTE